nr:hypothetical protein Iba_chr15eCG6780 [Ipomoea batatas]
MEKSGAISPRIAMVNGRISAPRMVLHTNGGFMMSERKEGFSCNGGLMSKIWICTLKENSRSCRGTSAGESGDYGTNPEVLAERSSPGARKTASAKFSEKADVYTSGSDDGNSSFRRYRMEASILNVPPDQPILASRRDTGTKTKILSIHLQAPGNKVLASRRVMSVPNQKVQAEGFCPSDSAEKETLDTDHKEAREEDSVATELDTKKLLENMKKFQTKIRSRKETLSSPTAQS